MEYNSAENRHISNTKRWAMLIGGLFAGLVLATLIGIPIMKLAPGSVGLLVTHVVQNILAFILPAVFVAALIRRALLADTRRWAPELALDRGLSWKWIAIVVMTYALSLPAMNYLVDWNENIQLPVFEQQLRFMEDNAKALTNQLLDIDQWWQLVVMVAVVGVVTGIGEEFFFRGGLLKPVLRNGRKVHLAIWTVALIFSASHMQFYGFVPRMLLGAWLGYLLLWSRSLWVPVLAHALNNSLVVVVSFLGNRHLVDPKAFDAWGVPEAGCFPRLALASAILWLAIWIFLHKKYVKSVSQFKDNY